MFEQQPEDLRFYVQQLATEVYCLSVLLDNLLVCNSQR